MSFAWPAPVLEPRVLKQRYVKELRPYLLNNLSWHDKTIELWLELIVSTSE